MISLAPLVLVGLVLTAAYAAGRHSHHQPVSPVGPGRPIGASGPSAGVRGATRTGHARAAEPRTPTIDDSLTAWTTAGLITDDQAHQIAAFEHRAEELPVTGDAPAVAARRVPFVAEALGYLGGILGIVGLVLLVAKYWPDMGTPGRLLLTGAGAAGLALAGTLVHEGSDAALDRLRWFLWLLSSVAGALFAGVAATEVYGSHPAPRVALVVASTVSAQNAAFWWWRQRPVQQFLTLAAATVAIGLLVERVADEGLTGVSVMIAGALLVFAAWRARTPLPAITATVGASALIVGSGITAGQWHATGLLVLVAGTLTLLGLAAMPQGNCTAAVRLALTVIGSAGALQAFPSTISYFAQHAGVATGAAVWSGGVCLVLLGSSRLVRAPLVSECFGGAGIVCGAAVMGFQSVSVATTFGLVTAVCLIGVGTLPGRVLMSLFGSIGLLVNVPWSITHFFPGEGRAPLLILTSGAVIVAVAVWLARMGGRFRRELRS